MMILLRHHNTSISASENLIVSFSAYTQLERIHNAIEFPALVSPLHL